MLSRKEIESEIARLEYAESSYSNYAKLADLYTILNQMNCNPDLGDTEQETVKSYGESNFLKSISGRNEKAVWLIIDDLMDNLKVVNQKVYNGIMRRIDTV